MVRITRIAGLMTAIAALALSVGASSASATGVYVCQVNGVAGQLTPGVQDALSDVADLNVLDTDSGTYHFSSEMSPVPTTCAEAGLTPVATPVQIDSNGAYVNTICGTGTAHSGVGQTVIYGAIGNLSGLYYDITFVAGSGRLTGGYSGGIVYGYMNITPDSAEGGGNCVNQRVTKFIVSGAFTAVGA